MHIPCDDDHHLYAALTDFFTEDTRIRAYRKDEGGNMAELFKQERNAEQVVANALRKYGEVTDFSLRYGLFGVVRAVCSQVYFVWALWALLPVTRLSSVWVDVAGVAEEHRVRDCGVRLSE